MVNLGLTIATLCFFIAILIELLISNIKKFKVYRFSGSIANISTSMISSGINIFFTISLLAIYKYVYNHFALLNTQPSWITILIGVIIYDFIFYWNHRWSHEWNILWGAHIIHHHSEDYNFSVALRQPIIKNFINFGMSLPMAIIGIHPEAYLTAALIDILYMFWIHTELIKKLPPFFEFIFNTPSHHRVHHASNPEYIDKNHGGILIIWDRMFGTFAKEDKAPVYGITTPLNSWNPIWANVHFYVELYAKLKNTKGVLKKIKLLFSSPAVLGSQEEMVKTETISRIQNSKFDVPLNPRQKRYIFTQFIFSLSLFVTYAYFFETLHFTYQISFLLLLILSTVIVTSLMELKEWAIKLEFIRLLFLATLIGYIFEIKIDVSILPVLASLGYFSIFVFWIYRAFLSDKYLRKFHL